MNNKNSFLLDKLCSFRLVQLLVFTGILLSGFALPVHAQYHVYETQPDIAIADDACVTSTINVPGAFTVADLKVGINLSHTYRSDLTISLTSPSGNSVQLFTKHGASADNLDLLLDDSASSNISNSGSEPHTLSAPYYENRYAPNSPLSGFDGLAAQGDWVLEVCDAYSSDTGRVYRIKLDFVGTSSSGGSDPATVSSNGSRDFIERRTEEFKGNFEYVGNTLLNCTSGCTPDNHNASPMSYVDIDGDAATFNSSSASIDLPDGAEITWAGLYWGGVAGTAAQWPGISAAPDVSKKQELKFKVPGGNYQTLSANVMDTISNSPTYGWSAYQAFADVTDLVRSAGEGEYTVADVQLDVGGGSASPSFTGPNGGWNLVVLYESDNEQYRRITVWDGYDFIYFSADNKSFTIDSIRTPPAGSFETEIALTCYDGEVGDSFGSGDGDFIALGNASQKLSNDINPQTNVCNGTVSRNGNNVTTRNPALTQNWAFDVDRFSLNDTSIIPNNATSLTAIFGSDNEGIWFGNLVLSTELFIPPVAEKSFAAATLAAITPDDMTITLSNSNIGGALENIAFTDTYPTGLSNASSAVIKSNSCSGSLVANANATSLSFSGGYLDAGESCSIVVSVIAGASTIGSSLENCTSEITSTSTNSKGKSACASVEVSGSSGMLADFGDAPESYGDASHGIVSGLHLGVNAPDAENGSQHSYNAYGDGEQIVDGSGTWYLSGDEDGASSQSVIQHGTYIPLFPVLKMTAMDYSADFTVTNTIGSNATLFGWIDFDGNGRFEADEAASAAVTNGTSQGTVTLSWNVPVDIQLGTTFIRLRLTSDTSISTGTPAGNALNGEVEDFVLAVALDIPPDSSAVTVMSGETPLACQSIVLADDFDDVAVNGNVMLGPNRGTGGGIVMPLRDWTVTGGGNDTYARVHDASNFNIGNVNYSMGSAIYLGNGAVRRISPPIGNSFNFDAQGRLLTPLDAIELRDAPDDTTPDSTEIGWGTESHWGPEPVTLSRSFTTQVGKVYRLYFKAIPEDVNGSFVPGIMRVEVPGGGVHFKIPASHEGIINYAIEFTADSTLSTIAFVNYGHVNSASSGWCDPASEYNNNPWCTVGGGNQHGNELIIDEVVIAESACGEGSVSGRVYVDANSNNVDDSASEAGIGSINVSIYDEKGTTADTSDDVLVATTGSAADGTYSFSGLASGLTYRLEVDTADADLPRGSTIGTTNPLTGITVSAGGTLPDQNFGFDPLALSCPAGFVAAASEGNATAITLNEGTAYYTDKTLGPIVAEGTRLGSTNAGLLYVNNSLTLDLGEVVPGWSELVVSMARHATSARVAIATSLDNDSYVSQGTFGANGSLGEGTLSNANHVKLTVPTGGARYVRFIWENHIVWLDGVAYDTACVGIGGITGTVYLDGNGNNAYDAGAENTLQGIRVSLLDDADGSLIASVDTDVNGRYQFETLPITRRYRIAVDTADADLPASTAPGTPQPLTDVVVTVGNTTANQDFGFDNEADYGDLSGVVYADADTNDVYDSTAEAGLGAVTVSLYDDQGTASDTSDDVLVATTSSAADGRYAFSDLHNGPTYRLEVDTTDADLPRGSTIGTANPLTGLTISAGGTLPDQNFGFDLLVLSCPAGFVATANEGNATAITLNEGTAYYTDKTLGAIVAEGTRLGSTNAGLLYVNNSLTLDLGDVVPGWSELVVSMARHATSARVAIATSLDNDSYVSQGTFGANGSLGEGALSNANHVKLTVPAGGARYVRFIRENHIVWLDGVAYDTTCVGIGKIAGTVYLDANGNNTYDAGAENTLQGIRVSLLDDADGSLIASVDTDANGRYQFETLPITRRYRIAVDTEDADLPASTVPGTPQPLADVVVTAGNTTANQDFGFDNEADYGDLSGVVYADADTDDVYDSTIEAGLGAVTVSLYDDQGTVSDTSDDVLVATTSSAADGTYSFSDLHNGPTYRLEVDTADADLPRGSTIGTTNPLTGITVSAGGTLPDQNFGFDPLVLTCPAGSAAKAGVGNATAVAFDQGVTYETHALGPPESAETSLWYSNSALLAGNDQLILDLGQVAPGGSELTISLGRHAATGRVSIATSLDNTDFISQGTFGNDGTLGAGVIRQSHHLIVNAPVGGVRYIRFILEVGHVWIDGVSYSDMCLGSAFSCDDTSYISQSPDTSTATTLYAVDVTRNPARLNAIGNNAHDLVYNATAYNPRDNYLYALELEHTNNLVIIDSEGVASNIGAIEGLPVGRSDYVAGTFDNAGNLYVSDNGNVSTLYKINLDTLTATAIPLGATVSFADLVFNPVDGLLYAVQSRVGFSFGQKGQVYKIDPSAENTPRISKIGSPANNDLTIGAAYMGSDGEMFGLDNDGLGAYRFSLTNGQSTKILDVPGTNVSDGANCAISTTSFSRADFEDAPVTYGSAPHSISRGIYLGDSVTFEATAANSPNADGDEDDGIHIPLLAVGKRAIIVADVTGSGGYLQGWIDWNGDGNFEDGDEQIITDLQDGDALDLAADAGEIRFAIDVPDKANTMAGQTFARLRFSTQRGLAATGNAVDGEVEDYALTVMAYGNDYCVAPSGETGLIELGALPISPVDGAGSYAYLDQVLPGYGTVDVTVTMTEGRHNASVIAEGERHSDWSSAELPVSGSAIYLEPSNGGTATVTYNFDQPTGNIDLLLMDLDFDDSVTLSALDGSGSPVTDFSGWGYRAGDISTLQSPDSADALPPAWNAATATLSSTDSGDDHRSFGMLTPDTLVTQIVVTFNTPNVAGRDLYTALHTTTVGRDGEANCPAGSISGVVYGDDNTDNSYNEGTESGIGAISISLFNESDDSLVAETSTAVDGSYSFTGLNTYTRYRIVVDESDTDLPDGVAIGTPYPLSNVEVLANRVTPDQNFGFDVVACRVYDKYVDVCGGTWSGHFDNAGWGCIQAGNASYIYNNLDGKDRNYTSTMTYTFAFHDLLPGVTNTLSFTAFSQVHNRLAFKDMFGTLIVDGKVLHNYRTNPGGGFSDISVDFVPRTASVVAQARFSVAGGKDLSRDIVYGRFDANRRFGSTICESYDYGDAPSSYGSARHKISNTMYLGVNAPDEDDAPQHTENGGADGFGDDNDGTDDEDGIMLSDLRAGELATLTATVSGNGYLQGWIDWNNNGYFDRNEQIVTNLRDNGTGDRNNSEGTIVFSFNVPETVEGGDTFARFRWSDAMSLDSSTAASDGEVEDYAVDVQIAVPFECTSDLYQVIDSALHKYNLPTGQYESIGSPVNFEYSIGYRESDNLIYGIVTGPSGGSDSYGKSVAVGDIVSVDAEGTVRRISSAVTTGTNHNAADIHQMRGTLWVRGADSTTLTEINIKTGGALQTITLAGGSNVNDEVVIVGDAAYRWIDGKLHRLQLPASGGGTVTPDIVAIAGVNTTMSGAGAAFGFDDPDDPGTTVIYWPEEGTGDLYKIMGINTLTPTAVKVADTPVTMNNDGASCPSAISPFQSFAVLGRVFEDLTYGGGSGRGFGTSGTVGLGNATVEIYDANGNYLSQVATATDGTYRFSNLPNDNYYLRVVSDTVTSSRVGSNGSELAVMTYRSNGVTAVSNEVGGRYPALADASGNPGNARLNTTGFIFSGSGLTDKPAQTLQPITVAGGFVHHADFGFNFNTIVNSNGSGQGSLQQFVQNSNILSSSTILQQLPTQIAADYTAGDTVAIFMIPESQLDDTGEAVINAEERLHIDQARVVIDGRIQTINVGSGSIVLDGSDGGLPDGVYFAENADGSVLRNISVKNFGSSGVVVSGTGVTSDSGVHIERVVVEGNGQYGVLLQNDATHTQIITSTLHNNTWAGIASNANANNTFSQNSISGNGGLGIDLAADGVTLNDKTDAWLNYPELDAGSSVSSNGSRVVAYDFDLDVPANTHGYRVEFFSNSAVDPSGHGEGLTYLGHVDITSMGNGLANFKGSFNSNQAVPVNANIAVTLIEKTDVNTLGTTSEFSKVRNGNVSVCTNLLTDPDAPLPTVTIDENSTNVTYLEARDAEGNPITYVISGGVDGSKFVIHTNAPGALFDCVSVEFVGGDDIIGQRDLSVISNTRVVAPQLPPPGDYEAPIDSDRDNTYELTVTATDVNGNSVTRPISIAVQNVNEKPRISSAAEVSFTERQEAVVVDLSAYDPDAGDVEGSGLTYSLSGGADKRHFTLDPYTGVLRFMTRPDFGHPLDQDANNRYELEVRVADDEGYASSKNLVVIVTDDPNNNGITLRVRALLQGAFDIADNRMRDTLRTKGILPVKHPYGQAPFNHTGNEQVNLDLVTIEGDDAVVDWVLLELRAAGDPARIVSSKAVLIQRDGDLMDAQTGVTDLEFPEAGSGLYYLSLRHRNHLGVISAQALALELEVAAIDFSQTGTLVKGEHARLVTSDDRPALLWVGDVNHDQRLVLNGAGSDLSPILNEVLVAPDNTDFNSSYQIYGYHDADLNMDGVVLFMGPENDANVLLGNILLHPANDDFIGNFVIEGGVR